MLMSTSFLLVLLAWQAIPDVEARPWIDFQQNVQIRRLQRGLQELVEWVAELENTANGNRWGLITQTFQIRRLQRGLAGLLGIVVQLADRVDLDEPEEGTLRIVPSSPNATYEGRLEIYLHGMWGTVCGDFFDDNNNGAIVACNELDLPSGNATLFPERTPGIGRIWLDNVQCDGTETTLLACPADGIGDTEDCDHDEDVGISCQ